MASTKNPARDIVIRACQEHPELPSFTLAKMLYRGKEKKLFTSFDALRSQITYYRGRRSGGKKKDGTGRSAKDPIPATVSSSQAKWEYKAPKSLTEDYSDFIIHGAQRLLRLSDIHYPFHDERALEAAINYGLKKDPTILLLAGDIIDAHDLSVYEKDPRHRYTETELRMIADEFEQFRKAFPKARIIYQQGNHCHVDGTEVLTKRGWINFSEVSASDEVAQFNDKGIISYANPLEIHHPMYDGDVFKIETFGSKQVVTSDHNVVIDNKKVTASSVGPVVKESQLRKSGIAMDRVSYDIDRLRLLTWIICDGTIRNDGGAKTRVQFKLSKQRKIDRLTQLLDKMGIPYSLRECKKYGINKLQPYYIRFYSDAAREVWRELNGSKQFPEWFRMLNRDCALAVLEEILHTDGYKHNAQVAVITTSKKDADTLQEMFICCGIDCNIKTRPPSASGFENGKTQYHIGIRENGYANGNSSSVESWRYNGVVHCVTMPLGTIITRLDGKVAFSGNCDRIEKYLLRKAPELYGLPGMDLPGLIAMVNGPESIRGIEWVKDHRVIRTGHLNHVHGHEFRGGGGVNPARWLFLKTGTNTIMGHVHRISEHSEPNLRGQQISCWSTGCLSELKPQYMRHNKWNHGFAYVDVDSDGMFNVENRRIIDGKVK